MHTLSVGKGCISRQGTPLRTRHPRLRPAVTHCYSEMMTSGASLPFILEWTRACRGPFLSGVATTEEVSQRTAGGSARAKGPGRRNTKKKTVNAKTTPGNSSAVRPQDGRDGARAPPRGQMWHPNCNHLGPLRSASRSASLEQKNENADPRKGGDFRTWRGDSVLPRSPLSIDRGVLSGPSRRRPQEAEF